MGMKWFPWRFVVSRFARSHGFLDPVSLLSKLAQFAQPSEVAAPVQLLRFTAELHARGLMNSQAFQHNLDWIWPYWVERQFDPENNAFIPRAFSMTHINLTHRNWTAVGLPDTGELPIIDPRGLLTPLYDSWSLDCWIIPEASDPLIPSHLPSASQFLICNGNLSLITDLHFGQSSLRMKAEVIPEEVPVCLLRVAAFSESRAKLVVSLRPCNPEGVSFIHEIKLLEEGKGWEVNGKDKIYFDEPPDRNRFSRYREGDVYHRLNGGGKEEDHVKCEVGMATAAAIFEMNPHDRREIKVKIPLGKETGKPSGNWEDSLENHAGLQIPDSRFQFLYEAALRTLVLHSPRGDVYPGPYTYKHFWFRDAAFILHAMLAAGLSGRVEKVLDGYPHRQTLQGYFRSQDGEWDSNGEALWIMQRFCELTGQKPKQSWRDAIHRGGRWIEKKRLPENLESPHAGLFPPGFSAEHLGPNDYYYWDDFWGAAGLKAAGFLCESLGDQKLADHFCARAEIFLQSIDKSLELVRRRLGHSAIPASPYRRMDSGAIGSLAAGYPLRLWEAKDMRLLATAEFLVKECFLDKAFFHDIGHSGINPYLTLHVAQVLLRAGDSRFFETVEKIAALASPTGQWPEAIHPHTGGGCMGDGQHVWAAAEWVLMLRNCFLREEGGRLILCSGIPAPWLNQAKTISFGPAPTSFGTVSVSIQPSPEKIKVTWKGAWHAQPPAVEILLPDFPSLIRDGAKESAEFMRETVR